MSSQYTIRLADVIDAPQWEAVLSEMDGLLEQIGFTSATGSVTAPSFGSSGPASYSKLTEAESLAVLTDAEDESSSSGGSPPPQSTTSATTQDTPTKTYDLELEALSELEFELSWLQGVQFVINPGGFTASVTIGPDGAALEFTAALVVRFDAALLQPVQQTTGPDGKPRFEPDPSREYAEVALGSITVAADTDGTLSTTGSGGLALTDPVRVGDSSVIIEDADLDLLLSESTSRPSVIPDEFRGVVLTSATIRIPDVFDGSFSASNLRVGSGGLSGTLSADPVLDFNQSSNTYSGPLAGEVVGITGGISQLSLTFTRNVPSAGAITGELFLPFLETRIGIELSIDPAGGFVAGLTDVPDAGSYDTQTGLLRVEREMFAMDIESLSIEIDDEVEVQLSGSFEPQIGFDLPAIRVSELGISADGRVSLPGGWLDLDDQYSVDVGVVGFEITKFGMGHTDDGRKWVGFNGAVNLLEGIPAGASVDGLRVVWDESDPSDFDVSLEGVGVEFEVPGTLKFKGEVSLAGDEFRGEIDLELLALDMTIDAELVFGTTPEGVRYMGIVLDANLPAGIPLWATGLSLYGFGALYANKLEPNKQAEQKWFAVSGKGSESWFHQEPQGVMELDKWRPAADAMGFGGSVDLATAPDNGLSVATDLTLVMSFPGPIIMLQGRAELLEEGATVGADAPYQALLVLDNRAGSVTLGVDAHYDRSPLLDISASAEAYYDFADPTAWYLNLGKKDPREDRIRAEALSIFTAEAYLMLNNDRLATGIWSGYDNSWKFGPLKVGFEAWVSADALVNFQPPHFYGIVVFHGSVELSAFGIGIGLTAEADVEADVFDPFHLKGSFEVSLNVPWPFEDPSATVELEWGPEPEMPAIPDPLAEVGIGHEKLASTWAGEVVHEQTEASVSALTRPTDTPGGDATVVPLDARPEVTFARPVHDESGVTSNPNAPSPAYELVGDPAKNEGPLEVRYALADVNLLAWDPDATQWEVADDLSGTWAPVPASNTGDTASGAAEPMVQSKLLVSTRTPYHYSRRSGGAWEDAIDRFYPQYPCPAERYCFDFDGLDDDDFEEDTLFTGEEIWHRYQRTTHAQDPWPRFFLEDEPEWPPGVSIQPTHAQTGTDRAFVIHEQDRERQEPTTDGEFTHHLQIYLPQQLRSVRIRLRSLKHPTKGEVRAYDMEDNVVSTDTWSLGTAQERSIVFTGDDAQFLNFELEFDGSLAIVEVCSATVDLADPGFDFTAGVEETRAQLARWNDAGDVLEPYTEYRLELITTAHAEGRGDFAGHDETTARADYIAFRTEGPPGLSTLEPPEGSAKADTGLEDLARYVHQTTPATVPAVGEQPPLPRPVYRADPAGVDFASDYVDLLYRLANRDLALYLYDANDQPVRDAQGRLVVETNQWGTTESLLLDRATRRWFARLDTSPCLDLEDFDIERTKALSTGTDRVLEPDAVHEARLRPLLYRETWAEDDTGWTTVDEGAANGTWRIDGHPEFTGTDSVWLTGSRVSFADGGFIADLEAHRDTITFTWDDTSETYAIVGTTPSNNELTLDGEPGDVTAASYTVPARHELRQTTTIGTTTGDTGTFHALVSNPDLSSGDPDQPAHWSDLRVQATIGSTASAAGVIGLIFRRQGRSYYRIELEAAGSCRLHRLENGTISETWAAPGGYTPGMDVSLTVETIGDDLQILVDDTPKLHVTDPDGPDAGAVGLYCRGTDGFRCSGLRVDDFRDGAPVAYRYSFTTSRFVDAFHQLHSYDDNCWTTPLPTADLPATSERADPATSPTPAEHRRYQSVASNIQGAGQLPDRLEVTRLTDDDTTTGLFVQSPEPIDWPRTSLSLERGPHFDTTPTAPATLKLTGFDFDSTTLTAMLRETSDLDATTVEYRRGTTPGFSPTPTSTRLKDNFGSTSNLDDYTVIDPVGDADWQLTDGHLIATVPSDRSLLLNDATTHTDGVLETRLTVEPGSEAGLVFRYRSPTQHYRLERSDDTLSLIQATPGGDTTRHSQQLPPIGETPTSLRVRIEDGMITGMIDDVTAFTVVDPTPGSSGRIGIATTGTARIHSLSLHESAVESVLLDAPFDTPALSEWRFVKEPPFSVQSPDWRVEHGELRQRSNIYGFVGGPYAEPGTYAVTGDPTWTDYRTTVLLQSDDNDAIGVIVRYQNDNTYYRFSMDAQREYRRLVRKHDGETTLLWEDTQGFTTGREYVVTIDCVGDQLTGYLDGEQLFTVTDETILTGKIGVYCRANRGARFKDVRVVAPTDGWVPYHTFEEPVTLDAGTRLAILDEPTVSDVTQPRRERRARNGPPVALSPDAVEFRVRPPEGDPTHRRQFRAPSAYTVISQLSVLRSADGTGLLLFDDSALTAGQYRLTFTPSGANPLDSTVTIDIPWHQP